MDTPTLVGTGFLIVAGVVWVLCAYLAYQTAPRFGRRAITWGILGIFLGPIALFALYVLPKGNLQGQGQGSSKKQDEYAARYQVPKKKR
jgi:hypothetical protein